MSPYTKPTPDISGWLDDSELDALYGLATGMNTIVEVGSWFGKSTHALCSGCPGHVISVDHFKGSASQINDVHQEAKTADIYAMFQENMKGFKNLSVLRMDSGEAAAFFKPRSVDMVFIDGDHEYSQIRRDIEVWGPVARVLLCGHDLKEGGVEQALIDLGMKYTNEVVSIWAVRL